MTPRLSASARRLLRLYARMRPMLFAFEGRFRVWVEFDCGGPADLELAIRLAGQVHSALTTGPYGEASGAIWRFARLEDARLLRERIRRRGLHWRMGIG